MKVYLFNILLWLDEGINVVLGGGDSRETVSSRWGRLQSKVVLSKYGCKVLGWLSGNPNHCQDSIEPPHNHTDEI